MKTIELKKIAILLLAVGFTACGNSDDSEKKIKALERQLAEAKKETPSAKENAASTTTPDVKPEGPIPSFEWTETEYDFGTINEDDVVEHSYTFKNTGEAPLVIESVRPSCGCTAPNWTKTPVPIGGSGVIDVKFDSKGKKNTNNKTVTVTANTWPKQTTLRFKAFVTPKAD